MSKKPILLVVWLALLGGLLFGITRWQGETPTPPPVIISQQWPQIVAHAAAPARGNPHARYTVAEFGDFQCPQCGHVWPLLETLLKNYPAQINVIFVHRPFPNIHAWALTTAEAAQAAAAQGKFWPMYDALYSHQKDLEALAPTLSHKDLPPGALSRYAALAGLDGARFEAEMKTHQERAAVDAASQFADSIPIDLTPTLLVHDNVTGTVTVYIGLKPKTLDGEPPGRRYFDRDFLERLPWLPAKHPHSP